MADVKTDSATESTAGWDEAKYKEALAKLQALENSIGNLRYTVPFMLETCSASHRRPEELYGDFRTAASEAVKGIQALRDAWSQDDMKSLLHKAKEE